MSAKAQLPGAEGLESLARLFSELGHSRRLALLLTLRGGPMRLKELQEAVDVSPQEGFRHLGRLHDAGLLTRVGDGAYALSGAGEGVLRALDGFRLITEDADLVAEHDLSVVPAALTSGLGILKGREDADNELNHIQEALATMSRAKRRIWTVANQSMSSVTAELAAATHRGVEHRTVLPSSVLGDPRLLKSVHTEKWDAARVHVRSHEGIRFILLLTENEGRLYLPTRAGRLDIARCYHGTDEAWLEWCRLLFLHYWVDGKPMRYVPSTNGDFGGWE